MAWERTDSMLIRWPREIPYGVAQKLRILSTEFSFLLACLLIIAHLSKMEVKVEKKVMMGHLPNKKQIPRRKDEKRNLKKVYLFLSW